MQSLAFRALRSQRGSITIWAKASLSSRPPKPVDFSKMSMEELEKQDMGSNLLKFVEGTEYDRKLDEMIAKLEAQGFSEREILEKMVGSKPVVKGDSGKDDQELFFDPSLLDIDGGLFREFSKVMDSKKNNPELVEMLKKMAEEKTRVEEGELSEGETEFVKK